MVSGVPINPIQDDKYDSIYQISVKLIFALVSESHVYINLGTPQITHYCAWVSRNGTRAADWLAGYKSIARMNDTLEVNGKEKKKSKIYQQWWHWPRIYKNKISISVLMKL